MESPGDVRMIPAPGSWSCFPRVRTRPAGRSTGHFSGPGICGNEAVGNGKDLRHAFQVAGRADFFRAFREPSGRGFELRRARRYFLPATDRRKTNLFSGAAYYGHATFRYEQALTTENDDG